MASTDFPKRKRGEDLGVESSRVPSIEPATSKKIKTRRQKDGKRIVGFEGAIPSQALDKIKTSQKAKPSSPLNATAPLQHSESRASTSQACANQPGQNLYDVNEPDMLSALDRAALKMIEAAKEQQRGHQVELEVVKRELKIAQEELCRAQKYGKTMKQSREKALEDLNETKKVLHITEIASKIYEVEYKSGREELGEAEMRLQTTREENHRFFRDKETAERLLQLQESCTKEAVEMVERLRGELATERGRVAVLELKYGV